MRGISDRFRSDIAAGFLDSHASISSLLAPNSRVRIRTLLVVALALSAPITARLGAQPLTIALTDFAPGATDVGYSRVAVGADGSVALAVEIQHSGDWKVAVQRYSSSMQPVGPLHSFEGCGIMWTGEFTELPEIAFHPTGHLIVLIQQTGDYHLGGDSWASSEIHLGLVDPVGQRIDTAPGSSDCTDAFVYFDDGDEVDRARMTVTPNGELLIIADGFFGSTNFRNVALHVKDAELDDVEALRQIIPHTDELSAEALHWIPDVATNGQIVLTTWQECPIVDNQGNYNDCDIRAQFATITSTVPQAIGGNRAVNSGDTPGTLNILASADMNAAGNSVVVWLDDRVDPWGAVFGQRFDSSGQPVGENFQISAGANPFPSTDAVGFIYRRPEVAVLDDGRFMVVWTETASGGSRGVAMARRFSAAGEPLEAPQPLLESSTMSTGFPHVKADGSRYAVTWIGAEDGQARIFLASLGEPVSREDAGSVPSAFRLDANYPNPFNPSTSISFELPEATHARLTVHDLLGREVAVLVDALRPAGRHTVIFDAADLPSGIYLYRLEAGRFSGTRRATLLR